MPFSDPTLPDWLARILSGFWGAVASSVMARLMYHARLVQMGKRQPFGLHLVWEMPTAFSMAIIGAGLAEYLGLGQGSYAQLGLIGTMSFLGPRILEDVFAAWLDRRKAAKGEPVE